MPRRFGVFAASLFAVVLLAACAPQKPKSDKTAAAATVAPPPLIARRLLFGNPERANGQISPDGRWLGYVAPDEGVLNVFVAPREHPEQARVITHDRKRGVRNYFFAYDGKHLLYPQDEGGNENHHFIDHFEHFHEPCLVWSFEIQGSTALDRHCCKLVSSLF